MATILKNQAQIYYNYGTSSGEAVSNETETAVVNPYSILITKWALTPTYRPDSNVSYLIRVENNSQEPIYNIAIADNLGSTSAAKPLRYIEGSMVALINGAEHTIAPSINANGDMMLAYPLPAMEPGDVITLAYASRVSAGTAITGRITNTATATGNGGSVTGPAVSASAEADVEQAAYASVTVLKEAPEQVLPNGTLNYTLTLSNTGNMEATGVTVRDVLPEGYTVTEITATTEGLTVHYLPEDWIINPENNEIRFPNAAGSKPINVPAMGSTTIVMTGTVHAVV